MLLYSGGQMNISTKIVCLLFLLFQFGFSDDGTKQIFDHVEMNINSSNYILFEDNSLIVCDRYTDEYLAEITEDFELYVRGKEVEVSNRQRDLLEQYYMAQYNLFSSRNIIGTKGIEIGMQSAGLAIKAVGGAFVLIASGFDEQAGEDFEDEMEYESEKIEQKADELEREAEEFEYQIDIVNDVEWKIKREIKELDNIDLYVDEDALSISVD
jgi:hypothetical protein